MLTNRSDFDFTDGLQCWKGNFIMIIISDPTSTNSFQMDFKYIVECMPMTTGMETCSSSFALCKMESDYKDSTSLNPTCFCSLGSS